MSRSWTAFVASLFLLATGCNVVPPGRSAVDSVTIRGTRGVDDGEIEDKIATTATTKFLGVVPGFIYEYSVFDRNVFQRDLARVEAIYRSKGYYDAHARAGRIFQVSPNHVRVEVVVEEGEPILVRGVVIEGTGGIAPEIVALADRGAKGALVPGKPFDEEAYEKAKDAVRRALTDNGYAYAKVERDAALDVVARQADIVFTVAPGERQVFGPVTIEGLESLPEKPVRRAIDIAPGEPFSEAALESARQAVLDLGVFAGVDITPDLADPPRADHIVPVKVKLVPAKLHTIRLGGGLEFDALKSDVHGLVGWQNRNLFGGMRSFSVTVSPGLVLYPLRVNNLVFPNKLLPEARARIEFKQPGFPEARTNLFVRPSGDVQPLLFDSNPPPGTPVIGYAESLTAVGLERTYWRLYTAVAYDFQVAYPFAYLGERDPTLGTLVISYPELVTQLDFRDDRVHPKKGVWLGNTLQVAGGPFGGQADDVKIQPDVRGYVPLARGVVLAMRGSLGFLFAQNYGAVVRSPGSLFENTVATTRDYQLTFFRGFFSGGPSQNRGYTLRGVGPHAIVPFISPQQEALRLSKECVGDFDCRTPTGGFTLWEASTEVRFKVTGPLSVATFCDASDVSPQTTNIRLTHLHLSCGAGGRYDTPVGPIRLDIGMRIPGLQVLGGLTPDERKPDTFAFGIPIAVSLGIGEAY